jgi:hypothetical protein
MPTDPKGTFSLLLITNVDLVSLLHSIPAMVLVASKRITNGERGKSLRAEAATRVYDS